MDTFMAANEIRNLKRLLDHYEQVNKVLHEENARLTRELAGERRRVIEELAREAERLGGEIGTVPGPGILSLYPYEDELDEYLIADWLRSHSDPAATDAPEGGE